MSRADTIRRIISENTGRDFKLDLVETDLTHDDRWGIAIKGCYAILHVASHVPVQLPKYEDELIALAREGTLIWIMH